MRGGAGPRAALLPAPEPPPPPFLSPRRERNGGGAGTEGSDGRGVALGALEGEGPPRRSRGAVGLGASRSGRRPPLGGRSDAAAGESRGGAAAGEGGGRARGKAAAAPPRRRAVGRVRDAGQWERSARSARRWGWSSGQSGGGAGAQRAC